jgi:putative Mn2+ efflux pump MntP
MHILTLVFIAFGLAMDALAVSIASGVVIKRLRIDHALRIALFFGAFQAAMPIIGWLAGSRLKDLVSGVDHWIAFGLLSLIGCKMIYESTKMKSERREINPLNASVLLLFSIATSIDALAIGISFAFLQIAIITPAVVIGMVTFLLSFLGVYIGNRLGHFFEQKIEFIGGLILIGIGIKILVEHLA